MHPCVCACVHVCMDRGLFPPREEYLIPQLIHPQAQKFKSNKDMEGTALVGWGEMGRRRWVQ